MVKILMRMPAHCIAIVFLCAPVLSLFAQSEEVENQIVEKLDIVIETQTPESQKSMLRVIKSRLKTREGDLFSQTVFDRDLKMLAKDYDRIEPLLESANGKISITITIWPNPIIRSICWEGNASIKTGKLQKELGIFAGSVFDRDKFNKAFNKVKAYYVKNGYFEAQLDYTICRDSSTNEVDITITVKEGRAGKIKRICFRNFSGKEKEDLLSLMCTKQHNPFLSWLTGEGIYNEEMIQHDKFIILNYLQNLGYADAKVDIDVCESKSKNRIEVHITAEKGAHYHIGDISFEGNTIFSDEELSKCLKVCPGKAYSPERLHESVRALTNYYGRCGYIETVVNYEPRLREESCIYDIKITIDEGEQYHVGMIKVLGNCSTQTKVILHETLLVPGEVFNLEKLQKTECRLTNIGYFKHVNVYAVKSEEECVLPGNYRDVHIEVEEDTTGNLGAFLGFSTVENMFGGINLTERNFNYKGLGCFWKEGFRALRGGGEYAHITLQLGVESSSYVLSWTKPYFMDTPWSVGFDLDRTCKEYIADDYEIKGYGLTVHATYECNAFLRVGTHYRIRYNDVHVSHDLDTKQERSQRRKHGGRTVKDAAKNEGIISAVGFSCLYDSTDSPIKPTCGLKSRLEGEVAGLGGDYNFLSVGYLNSYYFDLWGKGVLKVRGDFRFIQPLGDTKPHDLPLDERFFLGGDNIIRGYRAYRLGPKFYREDGKKDEEDPRGGLSMQIFSIEYSKPVFSKLDVFLFGDAGSLSMEKWDFAPYFLSVGYGVRLQVFGNAPPLTAGMGYPLNPRSSHDVKRFFITVGGRF